MEFGCYVKVSGIGIKMTYEKVRRYLAQKAGIEENKLTVLRFIRSSIEKGVCVLIVKGKDVVDQIKRILKDFHNWIIKLFERDPIEGYEQSPIYVTITYSVATMRSPPSTDLLQTKLDDKFKKSKVRRQIRYHIYIVILMYVYF